MSSSSAPFPLFFLFFSKHHRRRYKHTRSVDDYDFVLVRSMCVRFKPQKNQNTNINQIERTEKGEYLAYSVTSGQEINFFPFSELKIDTVYTFRERVCTFFFFQNVFRYATSSLFTLAALRTHTHARIFIGCYTRMTSMFLLFFSTSLFSHWFSVWVYTQLRAIYISIYIFKIGTVIARWRWCTPNLYGARSLNFSKKLTLGNSRTSNNDCMNISQTSEVSIALILLRRKCPCNRFHDVSNCWCANWKTQIMYVGKRFLHPHYSTWL